MTATCWEPLPLSNKPVREILYSGNGKDGDLTISYADGSTGTVGGQHVSISCIGPVQLTVESLDDLNLAIRLVGAGLTISSGRIVNHYTRDDALAAEFRDDLGRWVEGGCRDLGIVTPVELELAIGE
ncbi:hypothetical protein ACFXHA_14325 [Nocardia sp. NPDC059240]|uniref:hypothetical protein n=1 Tax=Nocardia sp. NPDC059240 TaxID=3346786 RepID=UPI0036CB3CCE